MLITILAVTAGVLVFRAVRRAWVQQDRDIAAVLDGRL